MRGLVNVGGARLAAKVAAERAAEDEEAAGPASDRHKLERLVRANLRAGLYAARGVEAQRAAGVGVAGGEDVRAGQILQVDALVPIALRRLHNVIILDVHKHAIGAADVVNAGTDLAHVHDKGRRGAPPLRARHPHGGAAAGAPESVGRGGVVWGNPTAVGLRGVRGLRRIASVAGLGTIRGLATVTGLAAVDRGAVRGLTAVAGLAAVHRLASVGAGGRTTIRSTVHDWIDIEVWFCRSCRSC